MSFVTDALVQMSFFKEQRASRWLQTVVFGGLTIGDFLFCSPTYPKHLDTTKVGYANNEVKLERLQKAKGEQLDG